MIEGLSNRYNHFGFKYIDGLTTNNKEHLKYSPVEKKKYIPNAITDKQVELEWDTPFVFWVANIKNRKRPEIFIDAAKHFEKEGVDFLMVGKISDHKFDWIKNPDKTPSNFFYLGPKTVEEVNGMLSDSLFLVTTSTPEGFSNNLIQAWLQGKPTVSFELDPGGLIASKNLGYVCNSSTKIFLEAIENLLTNKDIRKEIGNEAGKFADSYFSKEKTIDLLESFMQEIYKS